MASTSNAFLLLNWESLYIFHSLFIQREFGVKNGSTNCINMPLREKLMLSIRPAQYIAIIKTLQMYVYHAYHNGLR